MSGTGKNKEGKKYNRCEIIDCRQHFHVTYLIKPWAEVEFISDIVFTVHCRETN